LISDETIGELCYEDALRSGLLDYSLAKTELFDAIKTQEGKEMF